MIKLIYSDSFDDIVGIQAKLVEDPRELNKSASTIFGCDYEAIKPDKNHVGIHLVGLGDYESYGPNRNADAFSKHANEKYGQTFLDGHVFRHHNNKDPEKAIGSIVKVAHNDPMGRMELFIHAHKEKAAPELARLEKDGEHPFSMACFLDSAYPILTIDGYKGIGDIKVGNEVLTQKGLWKKVTAINRRKYSGTVIKLGINGLAFPMELTGDHLLYAKHVEGEDRTRLNFDSVASDWIHVEHLLVNDRLTYLPVGKIAGYGAIDNIELARILGYWIAEGSFSYNNNIPCTVQFTCNIADAAVRMIPVICEKLWPGVTCNIRPNPMSIPCVSIEIFNTDIAKFLLKFAGKLCRGKFICPELFNAADEVKYAFLGAWLDGDGFIDTKGVHWSTSSRNLVLQGRDLLASLGIASSVYKIDHSNCMTSGKDNSGVEYTLNISKFDIEGLIPWSDKLKLLADLPERKAQGRTIALGSIEGELSYRVKSIETYIVKDMDTYNIEVDTDPSYSAAGIVSHNCKVPYDRCSRCNTLRKTASDPNQCEHVKYGLGKMAEDGKLNFVFNDQPKYFDMSFVNRPADRIAYSLKYASDGGRIFVDSITLAKESGLWVPEDVLIDSAKAKAKRGLFNKLAEIEIFYRNAENNLKNSENFKLWEMRKAACSNLDDKLIETFRTYGPELLFIKLADSFVILPFRDFCKYAFGTDLSLVEGDTIKEAASLINTGIYSYLNVGNNYADVCNDGYFDYSTKVNIWTKSASSDLIYEARHTIGLAPGEVEERAINVTLSGQTPKLSLIKLASYSDGAIALASKYASYKLSMLDHIFNKYPGTDKNIIMAMSVAQDLFNSQGE